LVLGSCKLMLSRVHDWYGRSPRNEMGVSYVEVIVRREQSITVEKAVDSNWRVMGRCVSNGNRTERLGLNIY
jgi:hypothetical protein